MTHAFLTYVANIKNARHFWMHLVLADLRAKYRRSWLGLGWSILYPLVMTGLLTCVMSKIFHAPVAEYGPYIFSGLIFWEFLNVSTIAGCSAFVNAHGYIKQFTHPLAIYSLRSVCAALINLLLAFLGLILWVMIWKPSNFTMSWLELPVGFLLLLLLAWPLATITAFIGARFHDSVQLAAICMQALWYVSPVFFPVSAFLNANLNFLVYNNPIYHILELFRAPLLHGQWPQASDYAFVVVTALVLWLIATVFIRRAEKNTIFYL